MGYLVSFQPGSIRPGHPGIPLLVVLVRERLAEFQPGHPISTCPGEVHGVAAYTAEQVPNDLREPGVTGIVIGGACRLR